MFKNLQLSTPHSSIYHTILLLPRLVPAFIHTNRSYFPLRDHAAEFEGFDAEEFEEEDESFHLPSNPSPNPATTSTLTHSSTPESHHGPPSTPSPPSDQLPKEPSTLDFWDEDEFEGIPSQDPDPILIPESAAASDLNVTGLPPSNPPSIRSFTVEIVCVSFLIVFIINFFIGKRQNELIALSWASTFATRDSIFEKNFSLLGTGDGKDDAPLLLKEGQDVFKFYASGRRFCQGLLATMELKSRHDLIARMVDLVFPKKDMINIEVVMNEDAMDHVVLALGRRKHVKAMQKETRDLARFGNLVSSAPAGRKWVAEDLMVVTESKEVAGDLITEAVLDQVFGEKAFEKFGKWFISLHFSDQHPASYRKILVFKFVLPDVNEMAEMTRLVTLVPYYIDLIGRYKLSSQARSKTEAARAKVAQEAYKELQNARQEVLQRRKADKKKLMEETEAKLSAEALRKKEEKGRARQLKKSGPRVKMLRSG